MKSYLKDWASPFVMAMTVAALFNFGCILGFGSSVFFWDEWDGFVGFLNEVGHRGIDFSILWRPHNEHRIFLSKFVYWFASHFSTDPRWMMVLSTIVWWFAGRELYRALVFDAGDQHGAIGSELKAISAWGWAFMALAGLLFFSEVQAENFFWGFELCWFTGAFGVIGALASAAERRYLRTFVFSSISYLSLAVWPALVPTIAGLMYNNWRESQVSGRRQFKLLIALGVFGFVSCVALFIYLRGMAAPQHDRLAADLLTVPHKFIIHTALMMGLPFASMGFGVNLPMGILFFGLCGWVIARHRDRIRPLELALIAYSVMTAMLISKGRSGAWSWGHVAALRYSTVIIPAWLALLALMFRIWGHRPRVMGLIVFVLAAGVVDAAIKGVDHEGGSNRTRTAGGECLLRVLGAQAQVEESLLAVDALIARASPEDVACARKLYHQDEFIERARDWRVQGRKLF